MSVRGGLTPLKSPCVRPHRLSDPEACPRHLLRLSLFALQVLDILPEVFAF